MKSHLQVLRNAKLENLESVMILEDDFEFTVSPETFHESIRRLFQVYPEFDVCFLSDNLHESEPLDGKEANDLLLRVLRAATTSGYIVKNHYFDTLIQLYEWASPLLESTKQHWIYAVDQVWGNLQTRDRWVAFRQRLGKQSAGYSDIAGQFMDYNV
jgi:GR25 family glycosyltransferase involved in LPS biosynthesis